MKNAVHSSNALVRLLSYIHASFHYICDNLALLFETPITIQAHWIYVEMNSYRSVIQALCVLIPYIAYTLSV